MCKYQERNGRRKARNMTQMNLFALD